MEEQFQVKVRVRGLLMIDDRFAAAEITRRFGNRIGMDYDFTRINHYEHFNEDWSICIDRII